MIVYQVIAQYCAATRIEDLVKIHAAQMGRFGFVDFVYASNPVDASLGRIGLSGDAIITGTMPKSYFDQYFGQGLYRDCPIMRWAVSNIGACGIFEILGPDFPRTPVEMRLGELYMRHKMGAGMMLSLPLPQRNRSAGIALIGPMGTTQEDILVAWARHATSVTSLCQMFHMVLSQLPTSGDQQRLTRRQAEILELVASGRTMQEIADLLGRNVTTIEKHLRGAREALNASSTAQAVAKAIVLRQLYGF